MTCPICISNYNKSLNTEIICHYSECNYSACKQCVRTYLIGSTHEPHCMKCHNKWTAEFTNTALNQTFMKNEYKVHQKQLLLERALARREEFMPYALNVNERNIVNSKIKDKRSRINELKSQINVLQDEINNLSSKRVILEEEYGHNFTSVTLGTTVLQKFIMPCQTPECRGMLSHTYKCDLCNNYTCNHCFELKGENHTCNPDSVATATAIRQDTRPCPSCGERISKIDGCDQMWCIKCKTAFSWKTGAIETKAIHNPHYFEWMREHGLEQMNRCDDNDTVNIAIRNFNLINSYIKCVNRFCKYICKLNANIKEDSKKIYDNHSSKYKYDDIINFRNTTYKEVLEPIISNSIDVESYFEMVIEFNRFVLHIDDTNRENMNELTPESIEQDFKDVMCNYILGKYTKEELGNILGRQSLKEKQDRAFCDIYVAFVIGGKQIMNNFANKIIQQEFHKCNRYNKQRRNLNSLEEYENQQEFFMHFRKHIDQYIEVVKVVNEIFIAYNKHIAEFSKYINIELCKTLLNYGSKRELEVWDHYDKKHVWIKCVSVSNIKEKIEYFESLSY